MKKNNKKQEIVNAYAKVIEKYGLEGASLSEVAKEMGSNQSLIFHYFENKEDLTIQLTEDVVQRCLRSYDKAWPKEGNLSPAAFESFVSYVLEVHYNRRRSLNPKLYFALIYLMPRQKIVQKKFIHLADVLVEKVAAQLSAFQEAGVIHTADCVMSARTLLCLADGILCYDPLTPKEERTAFIAAQKELYFSSVGYHK